MTVLYYGEWLNASELPVYCISEQLFMEWLPEDIRIQPVVLLPPHFRQQQLGNEDNRAPWQEKRRPAASNGLGTRPEQRPPFSLATHSLNDSFSSRLGRRSVSYVLLDWTHARDNQDLCCWQLMVVRSGHMELARFLFTSLQTHTSGISSSSRCHAVS
jgi:hypothetical protein